MEKARSQKIKETTLLSIFFILLLTTLWVVFRRQGAPLGDAESMFNASLSNRTQEFVDRFEKMKKEDLFSRDTFKELSQHGGIPITIGKKGKENPFIPTGY
jgi:hypothetical protein